MNSKERASTIRGTVIASRETSGVGHKPLYRKSLLASAVTAREVTPGSEDVSLERLSINHPRRTHVWPATRDLQQIASRAAERLWQRPWLKAGFFLAVLLVAWLSGTGTAHS